MVMVGFNADTLTLPALKSQHLTNRIYRVTTYTKSDLDVLDVYVRHIWANLLFGVPLNVFFSYGQKPLYTCAQQLSLGQTGIHFSIV